MDLAEDLAGMTDSMEPPVKNKTVVVMAADHGIAEDGVSKYPREVTGQMIYNFVEKKGAGINALARCVNADVVVVDMGVAADISTLVEERKIISKSVRQGTDNIATGPAMSRPEAVSSVEAGIEVANELSPSTDIFGTGDMGIGNTTPSAAIAAVMTGMNPAEVTDRGTGIDDEHLERKIALIEKAISTNRPDPADGLDVLAKVGGFEIGGIAGLILGAAAHRKPVLVDGFISTAGALIAQALCPTACDYMIAAHCSVEKGHRRMHEKLGKKPLLDLNLRLGEGTGAALAMNIVEAAARVLTEINTFEEASVTGDKA
jgi:nicotinate-nucleotide--dimethylbenzimidazole phosphoribosyltransferase